MRRARVGLIVGCAGLFAALTMGARGCAAGASSSSVTASGQTLTIYASAPSGLSGDVVAAERLAFQQKQNEVSGVRLRLAVLPGAKPSDNARTAIQDQSTIAYIGELAPGASGDSIGITNAQDVLQVSPTDTAIELTQSTPAVPGAPNDYYEASKTYGHTFARVVPSAAQEAKAQVQEMTSLRVRRLYVGSDGTPYGAAIALAVKQAAPTRSITVLSSPSGADGAFYGTASPAAAARQFDSLAQSSPQVKLFGPSPLAAGVATSAKNVYVSVPGFTTKSLPPAGRTFVSQFKAQFGHAPAPEAIFGYESVASVLDVLREAGSSAKDRSTVVRDFFTIRNRSSVLGTYSINSYGETSIAPFVFGRIRGGQFSPLVQIQG
jgi:ABC-type branched-subunit amino acid transport system substrate-binding protein